MPAPHVITLSKYDNGDLPHSYSWYRKAGNGRIVDQSVHGFTRKQALLKNMLTSNTDSSSCEIVDLTGGRSDLSRPPLA